MINYFISFFRPELLFNFRPGPLEGIGLKISLTLSIVLLIAAIGISFYIKKSQDRLLKKGLKKFSIILYTIGALILLYSWVAYEGAPFLSARLWFLLLIAGLAVWLILPIKFFVQEVPKLREDIKNRREYEKYLP